VSAVGPVSGLSASGAASRGRERASAFAKSAAAAEASAAAATAMSVDAREGAPGLAAAGCECGCCGCLLLVLRLLFVPSSGFSAGCGCGCGRSRGLATAAISAPRCGLALPGRRVAASLGPRCCAALRLSDDMPAAAGAGADTGAADVVAIAAVDVSGGNCAVAGSLAVSQVLPELSASIGTLPPDGTPSSRLSAGASLPSGASPGASRPSRLSWRRSFCFARRRSLALPPLPSMLVDGGGDRGEGALLAGTARCVAAATSRTVGGASGGVALRSGGEGAADSLGGASSSAAPSSEAPAASESS